MGIEDFSIKEVVSVCQLIIAILCIPAYAMLTENTAYPFDLYVFWYQIALFSAGFFCLLFGLGTWFYRPKVSRTRKQAYIFSLIILWVLPIAVVITDLYFADVYSGDKIMNFGRDIWDDSVLTQFYVAAILGYAIAGLLFALDIFLTAWLIWKWKSPTEF